MATPKKSLALMIAAAAPKSRNPDGVTSASIAEPDQSGGMEEVVEEEVEETPMEEASEHENCIPLPAGFQAPEGISDGQTFDTTARVHIEGGKLYFDEIGAMPLESEATEEEEISPEGKAILARRKDEKAARSAFQTTY